MRFINNSIHDKSFKKPLGRYLIEAELIVEDELNRALKEQKINHQKIGNILVDFGYIKQPTLDYLIEKVIEPERLRTRKQSYPQTSRINLSSDLDNEAVNNLQIATNRLNKTLDIPTLKISPQKVTRLLIIIVFCLILVSSIAQFGAFFLNQSSSAGYSGRLFRLDEEINIPTLYSSLALAFCSILLGIIGYLKKVVNAKYANYWKALSFIFLYLAVDEMCSIHEMLSAIRPLINARGIFYFAWVIPGFIFVLLLLVVFWQFIQSLPKKIRNLFLIAGTIYVTGAIGVEMIGGYHSQAYGEDNPLYSLITTIEESMEMFGIIVFIHALLSYMTSHLKLINFRVSLQKSSKLSPTKS